jgi:serine/threonine protein kinase
MWKIADFGISAEGTARRAQTTVWARGTSSYRAAELVKDEKLTYTNKVDIWAMACILYEVAFQKKAFGGDMAVLSYALSKEPPEIPCQVELEISGNSLNVDTTSREAFMQCGISNHLIGLLRDFSWKFSASVLVRPQLHSRLARI